uniref:60S ribosomal protein L13-1-like n=1 Tax=Erigeron canadensis TaxID=72917 RepID=UPI001CB8DA28|nr:60S ribosomal protein L13-1-like [Erigeron canadensis]
MTTLVIFPRRAGKTKAGDYSAPKELTIQPRGHVLPIVRDKPVTDLVKITEEMRSFNAYAKLRVERANKRHLGARLKRAAEAK